MSVFASDKLVFGARAVDMYGEMLLAIRRIVRIETGARCAVRTLSLFSKKQCLALTVPARMVHAVAKETKSRHC